MEESYFNPARNTTDEPYEVFDLTVSDSRLVQMISNNLDESISYWNQWPFNLEQNDRQNLRYWLGYQMSDIYKAPDGSFMPNMGNRLQTASRAVLAYVNSRVANPEVAPSTNDPGSKQFALDLRKALYQHGVDHKLKVKFKKATFNLLVQKRGYLKLRFDPTCGPFGDVVVEHVNPEDVVVDKYSKFSQDPPKIYHRQRCSIEELVMKFPKKKEAIYKAFEINRGVYSQISRMVTYWEVWFTYFDEGKRKEGVCWYLPQGKIVLGKMENPNWIYTGDDQQDRLVNYSAYPIKPFVIFNYMNTGKSAIDETSLFEQAKPLQDLYNKRSKQIMENNDYVNGRTVADGNALEQGDAEKFLSKDPRTILLVKPQQGQNVQNSIYHIPHNPLPSQSTEEKYDTRDQVDHTFGASAVMQGQSDAKAETLGENQLLLQRSDTLADDLAGAVDESAEDYYRKLYQMEKVYYTEDHWIATRGEDGKYDHIMMQSDNMDTNVRISVEAGSTLPSNKQEMRQIIKSAGDRIDDLSFWEGMIYGKLPDPETIVTRTQKQINDPASYLSDVEEELFNREANTDITLLIAGKEPPTRDDYGQAYLEFFNSFVMKPKYLDLPPDVQQQITMHLATVGMMAARTANLGATQVDDAAQADMTEQEVATVA